MGGNALRRLGLSPRRISTEEQDALVCSLRERLTPLTQELHPVLSLPDKQTHGDTDLAALIPNIPTETLQKELNKLLQPKALLRNDNIFSLEFAGTQVDLAIYSTKSALQSHLNFCHFSPLGNILGHLLKPTGCRFGLSGLWYPVREKDEPDSPLLATIPLSQSIIDPLSLAGLNPKVWEKGFDSSQHLYEYLFGSPLLTPTSFSPQTFNHKNRQRMTKRTDFLQWITFLQQKNISPKPQKSPTEWQKILTERFPQAHLLETLKKIRAEAALQKNRRKKFSGHTLLKLGVAPTNIPQTLKIIKTKILEKKTLEEWVDSQTTEQIQEEVSKILKKIPPHLSPQPLPA